MVNLTSSEDDFTVKYFILFAKPMLLNNIINVLGHLRPATVAGGAWNLMPIRTNIRNTFPRARETKRIVAHGWKTRMSTPEGRRILMRRILKGRHNLSH